MKPLSAPSAPLRRHQSGRLRWPFAWLLACLLTAGMLALLAGVVRPPGAREAIERLQVALPAPRAADAQPSPPPAPPQRPPQAQPGRPAVSLPASPAPVRALAERPMPGTEAAALANPGSSGATQAAPPAHSSGLANAAPAPPAPPQTQTLAQRCPVQVKPLFPRAAQEDGIERGRVLARLHLDGEGRVREVSILEASPRGYFEAATRTAARQWRCLAPGEAGETVRVPFEFGID